MTVEQLLKNRRIEWFQIAEHGQCWVGIESGYVINCQSPLRFVGNDGTFLCSDDNGHQFGLDKPFNCKSEIEKRICNQVIEDAEVSRSTGDLTLQLNVGRVEIICNSAGYENWYLEGQGDIMFLDRDQRQKQ